MVVTQEELREEVTWQEWHPQRLLSNVDIKYLASKARMFVLEVQGHCIASHAMIKKQASSSEGFNVCH